MLLFSVSSYELFERPSLMRWLQVQVQIGAAVYYSLLLKAAIIGFCANRPIWMVISTCLRWFLKILRPHL